MTQVSSTSYRAFLKSVLPIALPIILQGFITKSLSLIDVLMIGTLGDVSVGAVGLGSQFAFVYIMLVYGVVGGGSIFTTQYWGKKDTEQIAGTVRLTAQFMIPIAILVSTLAHLYGDVIMAFYTPDSSVIETGSSYLRIVSLGLVPFAVSRILGITLMSMKKIRIPFIFSIISVSINTGINYCLIFGAFGFPRMGVEGAATATVIAYSIECLLLIFYVITWHRFLVSQWRELFRIETARIKTYMSVVVPGVMQGMGWVCGDAVYYKLYAQSGTTDLVAYSVAQSLEHMGVNIFAGLAVASSIVIGGLIGSGDKEAAIRLGRKFIKTTLLTAFGVSVILFSAKAYLVSLFDISTESKEKAAMLLTVIAVVVFFKSVNILYNIGLFKSGGDTKYILCIDMFGVWCIGVPLGALAVYVFNLPIYSIAIVIYLEEIVKAIVGTHRFISQKWIKSVIDKPKALLD
ncbi:MAG: MATE family efflux transporter [Fibrobacterales bacterium]